MQVAGAGLCHSDCMIQQSPSNYRPDGVAFTLGHESAGTVAAVGAGVRSLSVGQPVVVHAEWGCGECPTCRGGARAVLPGGEAHRRRRPGPRRRAGRVPPRARRPQRRRPARRARPGRRRAARRRRAHAVPRHPRLDAVGRAGDRERGRSGSAGSATSPSRSCAPCRRPPSWRSRRTRPAGRSPSSSAPTSPSTLPTTPPRRSRPWAATAPASSSTWWGPRDPRPRRRRVGRPGAGRLRRRRPRLVLVLPDLPSRGSACSRRATRERPASWSSWSQLAATGRVKVTSQPHHPRRRARRLRAARPGRARRGPPHRRPVASRPMSPDPEDHLASTTTSSSRPTSGPTACRRSTRTGPRGSCATRRVRRSRAARSRFETRRARRRLVRLCGSTTTSSTRSPSCRRRVGFENLDNEPVTFDADPPRLLEAEGTPRGHGRQPRRGVDLLPQRAAPLLRPGVPRAPGQGARAAVRAGLQRLDDRRVVRRCRPRAAHPADHHPAVGPAARRRRDPPLRRQGQPRGDLLREPVRRSACPSVHDKDRFWDPFFQACEETDTVVNMHIGSSSKMPSTSPDAPFIVSSVAHVPERHGLDGRLPLLRRLRPLPRSCASPTARARSAGCPTCSSGPTSCGRSARDNALRHRTCPQPPSSYVNGPHLGSASSTTRPACATAT